MSARKRLNVFERYLGLWVAVCMIAGVFLGKALPAFMRALKSWEFGCRVTTRSAPVSPFSRRSVRLPRASSESS